jgi:hypothetical protein
VPFLSQQNIFNKESDYPLKLQPELWRWTEVPGALVAIKVKNNAIPLASTL